MLRWREFRRFPAGRARVGRGILRSHGSINVNHGLLLIVWEAQGGFFAEHMLDEGESNILFLRKLLFVSFVRGFTIP